MYMQYETPIVDRAIFFDNPEITGAQVSPDGQYISFLKPLDGMRNIWVMRRGESFETAHPITNEKKQPISSYFWAFDNSKILYVLDNQGDENYHLYAVEPSTTLPTELVVKTDLTPFDNVRVFILRRSRIDYTKLIIAINDRDPSWHDVYSLNIHTGKLVLIYRNDDQLSDFYFDREDVLRMVGRSLPHGGAELLHIKDNQLIRCYETDAEESASIIRFIDKDRAYMVSNRGNRDISTLSIFNLNNYEEEIIEQDPDGEVDLGNVSFSEKENALIATIYTGARNRIYWKDQAWEDAYNNVCASLGSEEIGFISGTLDERLWIVYDDKDTDPGAAYLYDKEAGTIDFLYRPRPALPVEHLVEMIPLRYDSVDGLSIPAYISYPRLKSTEPSSAIIMVHGGPWARDHWGYNSWVQFLANRGYVVMQVNFRGSTGYGKAFLNAGNLEWGRKMQDDITAAAQYLIHNNIAKPDQVGILGGSYGGYATLAGLTFTPDIYACGVCIVGPSNLFTLLDSIPTYWESAREMFHNKMGNPNTEDGQKLLQERSPLFHADKIKSPLLVAQGNNDPRVKTAESEQIVKAMRKLDLAVEYLNFPDEGHGFANPKNNMAFLAVVEKFLAHHLGGRYQEDIPEDLKKILSRVTVDIHTL